MSNIYAFKNFTELTDHESHEVFVGRNDEHVRKWMTSDDLISLEEHQRFIISLKSSYTSLYLRVERRGQFVGVYSLNGFHGQGAAVGGFWVASYARDRLLGLGMVYNSINYIFKNYPINSIQGYQMFNNRSAAKLNALLGFLPIKRPLNFDKRMNYLELTRFSWESQYSRNPHLLRLIEIMESRNED